MLAALNTGHEGGCSTVHANDTADVVSRFEALGVLAGLAPEAVRTQLASAVRVVIHLRRRGGVRQVAGIEGPPAVRRGPGGGERAGVAPGRRGVVPSVEPGWAALAGLLGRPVGDHPEGARS